MRAGIVQTDTFAAFFYFSTKVQPAIELKQENGLHKGSRQLTAD